MNLDTASGYGVVILDLVVWWSSFNVFLQFVMISALAVEMKERSHIAFSFFLFFCVFDYHVQVYATGFKLNSRGIETGLLGFMGKLMHIKV